MSARRRDTALAAMLSGTGVAVRHKAPDERVLFLLTTSRIAVSAVAPDVARRVLAMRRFYARLFSTSANLGLFHVVVYRTAERNEQPAGYIIEAQHEHEAVEAALALERSKGWQTFTRATAELIHRGNDHTDTDTEGQHVSA